MTRGSASTRRLNAYTPVLTGIAAIAVAAAAAILLAPAQGPPIADPGAAARVVAERFSEARLDRAETYRHWSREIAVASLLVQFGVLAAIAFWRGSLARRVLERLGRRPLLGALAAGAGVSLLISVAGLPFDLLAWRLGRDYGLISQGIGPRIGDWLLGAVIAVIPAALGALVAMFLWRRLKGRFWIGASALVAAWALLTTWLWPVLISPLFNQYRPLAAGPVRDEVIRLADRAKVKVGEVYVVDASRRSSTLNAYVNGIGSAKRVVIYDNAIRELDSREFSTLVAHELGHVEAADLRRGLIFALLVIPLGVLFVQLATQRLLRRNGDDPSGPALIPVLALFTALAVLILQVPGNALSRQVEARADRYALELTGDPRGLVDLQVTLAEANLSDIDPPAIWQFLFGTHPSPLERIAIAEGAK